MFKFWASKITFSLNLNWFGNYSNYNQTNFNQCVIIIAQTNSVSKIKKQRVKEAFLKVFLYLWKSDQIRIGSKIYYIYSFIEIPTDYS